MGEGAGERGRLRGFDVGPTNDTSAFYPPRIPASSIPAFHERYRSVVPAFVSPLVNEKRGDIINSTVT